MNYGSQLEANIRDEYESRMRYMTQKDDHERKMKMLSDGMAVIMLNYQIGVQSAYIAACIPKRRRWWWFR